MECYFGTHDLPEGNQAAKTAVVTFSIPEIGIRFKAPFDAVDIDHSAYASLLALLEFIDSNQKYFSNHTYQLFCNNLSVVNQVKQVVESPEQFHHLLAKALAYHEKYKYSIHWVSSDQNSALDSLLD